MMFLLLVVLGIVGFFGVLGGFILSADHHEEAPFVFCFGAVCWLALWLGARGEVFYGEAADAGTWRKLDAQATLSALGGPSFDELAATAAAESVAWELRAAQAVATAQAEVKP